GLQGRSSWSSAKSLEDGPSCSQAGMAGDRSVLVHGHRSKSSREDVEQLMHEFEFATAFQLHRREKVQIASVIAAQKIKGMQQQRRCRSSHAAQFQRPAEVRFCKRPTVAPEIDQITEMERRFEQWHRCDGNFR